MTAALSTEAHFVSPKADAYLYRIHTHFAHKVSVQHTKTSARITFSCGVAELNALNDVLHIVVTAETLEGTKQTCEVVERHLAKFAWREGDVVLDWC